MIDEGNQVHLIDYGQAEKYLLENGSHRPNKGIKSLGNAYFASRNAFKYVTLSRRDDLAQIVYNMMALYN